MKRTTTLLSLVLMISLVAMYTPSQAQLVINEILADPPSAFPDGDANGDGARDASNDEFFELFNSGTSIDMSGWTVADAAQDRHVFPANTVLDAGCAIVVFGGGTPTGTFGGSVVQTASLGSLGFSNGGDSFILKNTAGDTVLMYSWGSEGGSNESLNRSPDLTGADPLVLHSAVAGAVGVFSPGTKADGSSFGCGGLNTKVGFLSTGAIVNETVGSLNIEIAIQNPDGTNATTADISLLTTTGSGDAADVGGFTTTSVSFAAGSSALESVSISLTDDLLIEGTETLYFVVENVAGGNGAVVTAPDTFLLVIEDDDINTGLVLNEVLTDPASGLAGDANGDGTRDSGDDEFVELANTSSADIDMSGWTISDAVEVRHIIPAGTIISPGCALLVFGGGSPTGTFGGATVQVATDTLLSLQNAGDQVLVQDSSGNTWIRFAYDASQGGSNQSINLNPDLTGTTYDLHGTVSGDPDNVFSPGTLVDGTSFACSVTNTTVSFNGTNSTASEDDGTVSIEVNIINIDSSAITTVDVALVSGDAVDLANYTTQTLSFPAGNGDAQVLTVSLTDDTDIEGDEIFRFALQNVTGAASIVAPDTFALTILDDDVNPGLIINELHTDPASDSTGDANGDGTRNATEDEFIEFVNTSSSVIDMAGWEIHDASEIRHTFPDSTMLSCGQALLVFGGGTPTGDFGNAIVQTSTTGNLRLINGGNTITIFDSTGNTVLSVTYADEGNNNQSITRNPDVTGSDEPFALHTIAAGDTTSLYSPGTKVDGSGFECIVGIAPENLFGQVKLYPNPAQLVVQLEYPLDWRVEGVSLMNMQGQIIPIHSENAMGSSKLQIANLPSGVYVVRISVQQGIISKKFLIQN